MNAKSRVFLSLLLGGALILSLTSCRLNPRDQGGDSGAPSGAPPASAPAEVAPPAPINCHATDQTADSVTFAWDFPGDEASIKGFTIYQGVTSVEKQIGPSKRSVTIGNLQAGVQYHFDVRAYNGAGESVADACFVDATPTP